MKSWFFFLILSAVAVGLDTGRAQEPDVGITDDQESVSSLRNLDRMFSSSQRKQREANARSAGIQQGYCKEEKRTYACSRVRDIDPGGTTASSFKERQRQEHFFILECTDHCGETRDFEAAFSASVSFDGSKTRVQSETLQVIPLPAGGSSQAVKPSEAETEKILRAKTTMEEAEACFIDKSRSIEGQLMEIAETLMKGAEAEFDRELAEEEVRPELLVDYYVGSILMGAFHRLGRTADWAGETMLETQPVVSALQLLAMRLDSRNQKELARRIRAYETELSALEDRFRVAEDHYHDQTWKLTLLERIPESNKGVRCFPHESTFAMDPRGIRSFYGPLAHELEQKLTGRAAGEDYRDPKTKPPKPHSPLQIVKGPASGPMHLGHLFSGIEPSSKRIPSCLVEATTSEANQTSKLSRGEAPVSKGLGDGWTQAFLDVREGGHSFGVFLGTRNVEEFSLKDPRGRMLLLKAVGLSSNQNEKDRQELVPRAVVVPRAFNRPSENLDERIQKVIEGLQERYRVDIVFDAKKCQYNLEGESLPVPVVVDDGNGWSIKNPYRFARCISNEN